MKNFKYFLLTLFAVLLSCTVAFASTVYPQPTSLKYVNDYASILDSSTTEYIVSVGKELEDKTGAQAVVVIVNSLDGNDIDTYANELFRSWGIGQKDKDNGLLILISLNDRLWRVEVGTGLEGAITDIYSARVMDNLAAPRFKEGNYSQGIKDAYSVFADSIAKEYNVTLDKNEHVDLPAEANSSDSNSIAEIFFIIFVIVFFFLFFRPRKNRGRYDGFGGYGGFGGFGGFRGSSGGGFGGFGGGSSSGGGSSGGW